VARNEAVPSGALAPARNFLGIGKPFSSLLGKLFLLLVIFVAVPVITYSQFRQADQDKRILLLESVREQGRLITESLRPLLSQDDPSVLPGLNEEVSRFATVRTGVKVLYRPHGEIGAESFFYVASQPPVDPGELDLERNRLIERGVFDNLAQSCRGELPIALRHRRPSGAEELLTSITPINTETGCWAVITTHATPEILGTSIGKPYWQTLEVKIAAGIYLAMAVVTLGLFGSILRGLTRFRNLARSIRRGASGNLSFAQQNQVPELSTVAEEFDRMTGALKDSAEGIRRAAEDNAHAFKTPIAIMRQSLEPLRRAIPGESPRAQRAMDVIEVSLDRLDHLVAYARSLEETTAELVDPPRQRIDLSQLVDRMLTAYSPTFAGRNVHLDARVEPGIAVLAGEDLLETVFENLIDNAVEISPSGSTIVVELRSIGTRAEFTLLDEGPGVPPAEIGRIFERYVSLRSKTPPQATGTEIIAAGQQEEEAVGPHLGIGLWIVRRNVQAIGGAVRAENRPDGGLAMVVRLPLAA